MLLSCSFFLHLPIAFGSGSGGNQGANQGGGGIGAAIGGMMKGLANGFGGGASSSGAGQSSSFGSGGQMGGNNMMKGQSSSFGGGGGQMGGNNMMKGQSSSFGGGGGGQMGAQMGQGGMMGQGMGAQSLGPMGNSQPGGMNSSMGGGRGMGMGNGMSSGPGMGSPGGMGSSMGGRGGNMGMGNGRSPSSSAGGYGMGSPNGAYEHAGRNFGDGQDNSFSTPSSQRSTRLSADDFRQSRSSSSFDRSQYDFEYDGQLSVDNFAYNTRRRPAPGSDTYGRGVMDEGRRNILQDLSRTVPRYARSSSVGDFRRRRPDRLSNNLGYTDDFDDPYYDRVSDGGYSGKPMVDYTYRAPNQYSREIGSFSKPKYSQWGPVGESLVDYQYRDTRSPRGSNYDFYNESRNPRGEIDRNRRGNNYDSFDSRGRGPRGGYDSFDSPMRGNSNFDSYNNPRDSGYSPQNLSPGELQQRRNNLMEYLEDLEDQEYGGRQMTYSGGNRMSNRDLSLEQDRVVQEFEDMEQRYGDQFDNYY
jgi:hypothetical protein